MGILGFFIAVLYVIIVILILTIRNLLTGQKRVWKEIDYILKTINDFEQINNKKTELVNKHFDLHNQRLKNLENRSFLF